MANLVLWNVPDVIVAAADARAAQLGLSRRELLLRQLIDANVPTDGMADDLDARFGSLLGSMEDRGAR